MWNSFYLAFFTAIIAVTIALLLGYSKRIQKHKLIEFLVKLTTLGYAIPGTVIAIAVMIVFTSVDHALDSFMDEYFNISTGLLLSGSLFILIFAYTFRFLSVSMQTIDSGLERIKHSMEESALSLGATRWKVLTKIHFPLLSTSLLTAFLLIFVEVLKELPTTLILRPFNFNTLSVRAYEMASDERLADAGLPALLIVLTGLIPVIILSRIIGKSHG
jgi:iron(III) transport system permease protein